VIRRTSNDGTTAGGGLAGIMPSKNALGALMALGIILWLLNVFESKKHRAIPIFMTLVCLFTLFQAKSAGAYLILIILMTVTLSGLLLKLFEYRSVAILTSILFLLTLLISFFVTLNLEAILGLFGKDLTLTGRSVIWPAITEAISQKVWAGYGAFSFWQPWRGPENPALSFLRFSYWLPPSAHQGFLDILLQFGVVGLVIVVLGLGFALVQSMNFFFKQTGVLAILPLTVVLHHIAANLPETRFLRPNVFWVSFLFVTMKLSITASQRAVTQTVSSQREKIDLDRPEFMPSPARDL